MTSFGRHNIMKYRKIKNGEAVHYLGHFFKSWFSGQERGKSPSLTLSTKILNKKQKARTAIITAIGEFHISEVNFSLFLDKKNITSFGENSSKQFYIRLQGAFHYNFPGFACWGYFIISKFKNQFALAQHSQDKNANQDCRWTPGCIYYVLVYLF